MSQDALSQKVELNPQQVQNLMELQIHEDLKLLEDLMSSIGHSQAKRILLSSAAYPIRDDSDRFKDDESETKIFSALKRLKDATVAFGVEVTIEQMVKNLSAEAEQKKEE